MKDKYSILKGFSAKLTPQFVSNFEGEDIIDYIEPDGVRFYLYTYPRNTNTNSNSPPPKTKKPTDFVVPSF